MAKTLFADQPDSTYRLVGAALLAIVLLFVDTRAPDYTGWLRDSIRPFTETLVVIVDLPRRAAVGTAEFFTTRAALAEENAKLKQENLVLQRHVQRLASLTAENARLRELLNSSALLDSSVLVAEIVAFDPDPSRMEVLIDKGSDDGLYPGQPVLDASGVMGQLVEVGRAQSRVILITDSRHGVPVEVSRNGVRSIAVGTGSAGKLSLQYLPITADVRKGDVLVSSGLGRIFPRGYPVATVVEVERTPGETFMTVEAQPAAALQRSRQVLLVFTAKPAAPGDAAAAPPGPVPAGGEVAP
ncbi:MAG: rod shape-determining protein MreC [Gammaproteobacteria bacterium]